jgi:hypothetical protein
VSEAGSRLKEPASAGDTRMGSMRFAAAVVMVSLGIAGAGGCGPGLEPPKASTIDTPGRPNTGVSGPTATPSAGTGAAAGSHAASSGAGGGHAAQAGAAWHAANDAGVEDDGGS